MLKILSLLSLLASPALTQLPAAAPTPTADPALAAASEVRFSAIRGHGRDSWSLVLTGGVVHMITVRGDGDSDLDAYLYDQFGNLVSSDDDSTDLCIVSVLPRWTGPFTLVVRNRGSRANAYSVTLD